jgi:hypothetical protein
MTWLTELWSLAILPFLVSYGSTILFAGLIGLVLGLLGISILILPKITSFIKNLAEKNLAEKVSLRIHDAIDKMENVLIDLLTLESNEIKRMAKEAYQNDNQIDMTEVKEIAIRVSEIAIERLSPEVSTISKYLAGDMIVEYIQDKVSAIIVQSVERVLNEQVKK